MIFLKSSIIVTLFLISNINPFKFPDYKIKNRTKSEINTTTESSPETTATTPESSPETIRTTINLTETQNGSKIESFCGAETGEDYCTDPSGYPEETILKAVAGHQGILSSFFDRPNITDITPFNVFPNSLRIHDEYDEKFEDVCSTRTEHIMPRAAKNTNGEFMFIVNHPNRNYSFTQRVQIRKCLNAGDPCGGGVFDVKTECHQELLEHKLVAIDKDGDHVVVDTFKFPSCCTCRIIKNTF